MNRPPPPRSGPGGVPEEEFRRLAEGGEELGAGVDRGDQPRRPRGKRAPIIELNDVTKVYPGGHMALDRVSLSIGRGEFVYN